MKLSFSHLRHALAALALTSSALADYGLTSRPSFTAYNGGTLPPTAPTFSGSWSTVPAFNNLTFINALGITQMPGTNNMVVWEREGRVYTFDKNANTSTKTLALDITAKCQGWDDSGLLALAFHPNFGSGPSNNRYVFIYYTWVTPGTVTGSSTVRPATFKANRDRLARFVVNSDGTIDPASETIFIDQVSQSVWHNGGGMFFHPDNGFLYLTNGDDAQASVNTQRIDRGLYSGVLRIDVDQRGGSISHPIPRQPQPAGSITQNYYIPNDNPFVGQANAIEELFCIGLRSPHRMTVDPVSKRIFIGDVGLASWEEIDVINPGESALNFQWDKVEGNNGDLTAPYIGTNRRPIIHYSHSEGSAVIGGYVYRGSEFAADLAGKYIFGDNGTGNIWYLDESTTPATKVQLAQLPNGSGPSAGSNYIGLSSFGVDSSNELYMCQMSSLGGKIYKLSRSGSPPAALPTTLSAMGLFNGTSFTNGATPVPTSSFIHYNGINPLWSDRADKTRWFAIPDGQQMGYAPTGDWTYPSGSVFLKHFSLPVDDANPSVLKRLETRVLVRDANGQIYGMTYKWRADNSDADLVTTGFTEDVPVTGNVDLGMLTSTDIGSPQAGNTAPLNGGYAVTGGGSDIFGTSDSFRYVASQKMGDFDIATRIESVTNANLYTKAGLMVRESLAANARNLMALVFPTNEARNNNTGGYEFQYRETTGGGSAAIYPAAPQPAVRYPNAWLRLKRTGDVFTAYHSRNGTTWTLYATKTLALPSTVYFGMAITSHTTSALATANFYFNINRTQPWYFPGRQDCLACHTNNSGGVLGINTQSNNSNKLFTETGVTDNQMRAWNHVGYLNTGMSESAFEASLSGLTTMASLNDTNASAEHRMRSYLDSNCAHCHRPGGVHAFWDARLESSLGSAGIINGIVQDTLGISGAKILVPQSVEQSTMYVRMASATAHYKMPPLAKNVVDHQAMAVLEQWISEATQPPADPLPSPWLHADIGNVGQPGDATYAGTTGTFIMSGGGDDIFNNADAFHFAYQPLSGDGEIVARVQSFSPTDPYTKAGLMIRESTAAGSKNVMVNLMSAHGSQVQWRDTTDGGSNYQLGPNQAAPYWLRLRRQGNVITGYVSGTSGGWTQVSSVTLTMNQNVLIGMALTAHNNAQTATGLFDNVSVTSGSLPLDLHINFQPAGAPVPEGYLADTGLTYGARDGGFTYGWSEDNTAFARDRNAGSSPDQRYDTLNHMKHSSAPTVRSWALALPNGTYAVHLVAGDPTTTDSTHEVTAEGVTLLSGIPTNATPFIEGTANITVDDGVLNLAQGAGGSNTKLCFIDITAVQGAVNVALTAPAHQSTHYGAAAATVNLSATASTSNSGASITSVEFYDGLSLIGSDSSAPFEFAWNAPAAGTHRIMAKAVDSTGAVGFSSFNDIIVSADGAFGVNAEYWPNLTMQGTPLTRIDSNIQFDWTTGIPMTGIPNDNFSVRWVGRIKAPVTGTYTFKTATDDGCRLWVNGQLIIDRWVNQGANPAWTGTIALTAGTIYEFEMHYFENYGGASALLSWSVPSLITETPVPMTSLYVPSVGANRRPRTPDILIPAADGELVDPVSIVMQSSLFEDQDAAQTHAATDWQIWSTDTVPVQVWGATVSSGLALTHAGLTDGAFVNGFTALANNVNYQLRVRHQDSSAVSSTEWSVFAVRNFTTTPPDDPRGVTAEYYANTTRLSTTPALTRTETNINYDYGNGAPPSTTNVGTDNFSVRWRARIKPQFSETYTFKTVTDDGARLWVNGQLLIDKWVGQGATPWTGSITLVAGQYYDLELQYFDGAFGASAKLYWSSPSLAEEIIPALRLYAINAGANHRPLVPGIAGPMANGGWLDVASTSTITSTAFEDQDAAHTHTATDWEIWDNDATPTRIWSALGQSGAKRTAISLSDGTFEGTHSGRTTLIAEAAYKIRLRHKDSSADANSEWSAWSDFVVFVGSGSPNPHGLLAEFYPDVQTFTGTPLSRIDQNINFNWVGDSPMAGVGVDNYVARWTGRIMPEFSETYTFKTESDDGVRLYVNGQLIIDKFQYQGTTQWTGTITLIAGQRYDIQLDYLEGGFDANVKLMWSSPSRPEEVVPGSRLYLPAPWSSWRNDTSNFTVAEQGNAAISGETADPDKDGLPNLLEYAFRTSPKTRTGRQDTLGKTPSELTLDFPVNREATDLVITVEWSTDLSAWSSTGVTYEILSTVGNIDNYRAHVALPSNVRAFLRVKAVKP